MTDTDPATRERLAVLVDPLPVDLDARLESIYAARPARRPPRRWPVVTVALGLSAVALGLLVWTFTRWHAVRPADTVTNGRIAFVWYASGSRPSPPLGSGYQNTDIYTMASDGSGVRKLIGGPGPERAPAWSPDGRRMAFIRGDNVNIANADGTGVEQITFCRYSGCVDWLAWSPDGKWIGYSRGWDLYLTRPDGTDNHLVHRCGSCAFYGLAWSPDGSRIVAGTDGYPGRPIGGLVLIDVGDPAVRGLRTVRPITFCELEHCHGLARDIEPSWSPDGQWIAFSGGGNIWEVDPDGSGLHQLSRCPTSQLRRCGADRPTWSPDGRKIAYSHGTRGIYVMNANGTGPVRIRKVGFLGSWQPVPAPPGETASPASFEASRQVVFERVPTCGFGLCSRSASPPAIVIAKGDGSDVHAIGRGTQPAGSPDGGKIAFKGLDGDLYVMNKDGTNIRRVFNCRGPNCHGMHDPTWSPDGTRITFEGVMLRGGVMRAEIYVIGLDGSGLRRVTTCERPACTDHASPAWSPDGRTIAFAATDRRGGKPPLYGTDIRTVDLDSGAARTIYRCLSGCTFQGGLDWSPGGNSIVFGFGSGLRVVDVDGSNVRQLTNTRQDFFPNWSADGRLIAFTRYPDRSTGGIYVVGAYGGAVRAIVPGASPRWSYLFPSWRP